MAYSTLIRVVITSWLIIWALPSAAGLTEGIQYLSNQVQTDGRIVSDSAVAIPYQSTAESLSTLLVLTETSNSALFPGLQFLQQEFEGYQSTENLSRLIIAKAEQGQIDTSLIAQLQSYQNTNGGFGELPGYVSSALDTAFALQALEITGRSTTQTALQALNYLLNDQNGNGGWSIAANASQSYVTALCLEALAPYVVSYQNVPAAISQAQTFLFAQSAGDGLWQEDFQSAAVLLALMATDTDQSGLQQSVAALTEHQSANGSWQDDVFTTALVLRALHRYQAGAGGVNTSESGAVIGSVVLSGSGEPIAGAAIALASHPELNVLSDTEGTFRLTGLPAGMQTLSVTKTGYLGASSIVPIYVGQQSDIGEIALAVDADNGVVRVSITDGLDQSALSEVTVSLTGPHTYQGVTDTTGAFEVVNVMPGSYSIMMEKAGYQSLSGQVSVVAGGVVNVKQSLLKTGAYLDTTPGDVTGRVIDGSTGSPLAGAQFTLNNGVSAVSDSQGGFILASLPRGSYEGHLTADGYQTQIISFDFAPGIIGNLGDIRLYPLNQVSAATSLTILGHVVDGVSGQALPGATVQSGTQTLTTDEQGNFVLSDLSELTSELQISADGYSSQIYTLTASGFGEVQQTFALPLANTDTGLISSSLSGSVKDFATGLPVAGATIRLSDGSSSTLSDASGHYELNDVSPLVFAVQVFALGYQDMEHQVTLSGHGQYTLDINLNALAQNVGDTFQIVSLTAPSDSAGADEIRLFEVTVANLTEQPAEALLIGQVVNANNEIVATVSPYLPGTDVVESHFTFAANENKSLTIPWNTQQNPPGSYRLMLRVVEPGTISRSLPAGVVLAEDVTNTSLHATTTFSGTLAIQPPITQAGTQVPIQLDALIVNSGNVVLANETLQLTVSRPQTGEVLYQTTTDLASLGVTEHLLVQFGDWIPTAEGDLPITIKAQGATVAGLVEGMLYVGDKASGIFTVDKTVVPEGNQNVQAKITLEGVDTAIGTSIDPLFFAVKQAVTTGGEYTAREALNWQKRNRCLGCHIQTQSLVGVAAAYQKNLGDKSAANTLYNMVASSQQEDGGLRANHPSLTRTQTALGLWSLTQWDELKESFRTLYRAAKHLYDRRLQSGNQTWWSPDHATGWWYSNDSHTAMTVKGYVRLLQSADTIDLSTISDYSLQSPISLGGTGTNNNPLDFEAGPDGMIYNVKRNGQIVQIDPVSGTVQVVGSSGHNSFGLAIDEDGTQYIVGDNGRLTRRNPDGSLNTLLAGGGTYTDIEIGPDGLLYINDYSNHRLLRMADPDSGQVQVVAQGGLLSNPYGLAFDAEGNAIIANFGGWNIIKVTPDGVVSIYADGLQYKPIWIAADQQGGFYYSSVEYYNSGQSTPAGINHLSQSGVIERLRGGNTLRGTVIFNQQVYVASYNENRLYEVVESSLNTGLLTNYANEVTRATNYFLARYKDNSSDNIVQAMRLSGLAEARKIINDSTLSAQVDSAIAYIEQVLRARQRPDGGWGRYTYNGSDAMATALVGLALDHTNPSADDPVVRKTIQYLLNNQLSDHSWRSNNNILSTRLAATSLVVAYLPVALERLGGIDVDLHLSLPANIVLNQPSIAPTSQSSGDNNLTHYLWQLLGVTSNSREVAFNLDLLDMVLGEERPVATEAYIQFKNSFTEELIRVDLPIPSVRAASELRLQVNTDKLTYQANETVAIDLGVDNTGPASAEGHIDLVIRAVNSNDALAHLEPLTVTTIAAGGQLMLTSDWMTGTTLAGDYEVFAQLFDTQNRLLDQQTTVFEIVHGDSSVIDGRVVSDKQLYQAWDQVLIDGRIQNVSANVIQPPTRYELIVSNPSGQVLLTQNGQVNELVPGALQDQQFELALVDAVQGQYSVTWLIQDAFSRELLATRTTTFTVERHILQGIIGQVQATPVQTYQGDPLQCLEQVNNLSSGIVSGLTLTSQLVSVESNQVIEEFSRIMDMAGGQTLNEQRPISTESLAIGEYACVLHADIDGQRQQIGAALFAVLEPPIKIEGHLSAGDRGRVLVLLDEAPKQCDGFSRISLEAAPETSLTAGTIVTASLFDANGNLLDQESGLLDDRLIDQQAGNSGVNLIVDDIAPSHIAVSVNTDMVLGEGYRLTVTADNGEAAESFDSGLVATDCSDVLAIGSVYGGLRLTDVQKLPAANDPLGPNHVPDLATQRSTLERILTDAGWSYTITSSAEDFTRELRSGGYVTYLLLSEQIKLDETVQKELREAVYRGEGLIEAGSHDQRQGRIDEALGLKFQGKHPSMEGISLSQNDWTVLGDADFQLVDRTLKASLAGASMLGIFVDQGNLTTETAMATFVYGQGRSLYMGFDLAAELALAGSSSLFESMLLDALSAVHPAELQAAEFGTYPLRVNLNNLGIATPGRVTLNLPEGVAVIDAGDAVVDGPTLTWTFDVAEAETLIFDAWLKLPSGLASLSALVQSGVEPDWTDQATLTLDIVPETLVSVETVHQQAVTLTGNDYKQVQKYLDWAKADSEVGHWAEALAALLRAADALILVGNAESEMLRIQVAQAIRTIALNIE
ncbi:MAG: carboxypeptidase regulatory-like domain-containing protein [Gammaproteobacteria bacterium]